MCGEQAKNFALLLLQDLFLPAESLISLVPSTEKLENFRMSFLLQTEVVVAKLYVHKSDLL